MLWLLACAVRTPPVLYPRPVPDLVEPPEPEPFEAAADECPLQVPFDPAKPAPHLGDNGHPTCRAQLVPESKFYYLLVDADEVPYWQARAETCHTARAADRLHGQTVTDALFVEAQAHRREAQGLRLATPAVFVGGVVVGLAVGVGAGVAAGVVSP